MPPIRALAVALACLVLPLALAAGAAAQSLRLSDPFDPGALTRDERRVVQAALALTGDYDALLDGLWGGGSQGALDAYARRTTGARRATWRDLRGLLRFYDAEHEANGWRGVWHPTENVYHLRPEGLLEPDPSAAGSEARLASPDAGLIVVARRDARRPEDLHDAIARDAPSWADPYRYADDRRIVTATAMREGRRVYMRSDLGGGVWMTHMVLADPANEGRMGLIASSMARQDLGDLDPSDGRTLRALLGGADRLPERDVAASTPPTPSPGPAPRAGADPLETILGLVLDRALDELTDRGDEPEPEPEPVSEPVRERRPEPRRAVGFRVNTTDIVTAARFAERCDAIETADGAPLTVAAVDRGADAAVLAGRRRAEAWLPLAGAGAREGERVWLLTRDEPRYGGGAVADGTFVDDVTRAGRLRLALSRSPAGAVLVDAEGRAAGMALEDGRGIRSGVLERMLTEAGIPFLVGPGDGPPTGRDVPDRVARAVVGLVCRE